VRPSNPANDNLIDKTIRLWQPRLVRNVSREDARQIAENVTGFFSILADWSRAEIPVNDNNLHPQATEKKHEEHSGDVEQGERGGSRP
jgi:hypothetical protein